LALSGFWFAERLLGGKARRLPHSSGVETPRFRFGAKGSHCGTRNVAEMEYTPASRVKPRFMNGLAGIDTKLSYHGILAKAGERI
jgi:hypothetical protein